ncbi:sugar kinase [Halorhabdus salina]|uniref:sugar kinase n=1 Tax=Halorhabdus salina TaxID=2750670 RepID=UPI0015EE8655|nr:sugar kinase [Halorhabdus salina]
MGSLLTVGETPLRFTPPGSKQFVGSDEVSMSAVGTESNVAIAAANLGTNARWLSKVPATQLGKRVISELHRYGAKTDVTWSETGRLGIEFYQRASAPREAVIVHDRDGAAAASMTPGELSMDRVQAADAVFAAGSTAALSETAVETIETALRAGRANGGLSVFELDFRPRLWSPEDARQALAKLLPEVDVLIANEDQLETVFERSGEYREIAHGVASEWDFDLLAMTRGEYGAIAIQDSVFHECESVETETVDPAGQHDAFAGAFIQQLLTDAPPDEALSYGVAAAAVCRTIPGPIPAIDRSDVDRVSEEL